MSDLAATAEAFADMAKAKALAAATNIEGRTCVGCLGFDRNSRHCEPLRQAELCQKQVYVRVALARLIIGMAIDLATAGVGTAIVREAIGDVRAAMGPGYGDLLQAARVTEAV